NGLATPLASIQSAGYFSGKWARVTFTPDGSSLSVEIFRLDLKQYLNASGQWQDAATKALTVTDASISAGEFIGLSRPAQYAGAVLVEAFTIVGPPVRENFDSTPLAQLPGGWFDWTNQPAAAFKTSAAASFSPARALASASASSAAEARAWLS